MTLAQILILVPFGVVLAVFTGHSLYCDWKYQTWLLEALGIVKPRSLSPRLRQARRARQRG